MPLKERCQAKIAKKNFNYQIFGITKVVYHFDNFKNA